MPTIAILSHNLLMESFLADAFRMEGWIADSLRLSHDVSRAIQTLERRAPDLLLIEFHPRQVAKYTQLLEAMRVSARLRHLPVLMSHYIDEPIDRIRSWLHEHCTAILTHDYDLDTLYAAADSLAKHPKP